jgi:hypothetical protein
MSHLLQGVIVDWLVSNLIPDAVVLTYWLNFLPMERSYSSLRFEFITRIQGVAPTAIAAHRRQCLARESPCCVLC